MEEKFSMTGLSHKEKESFFRITGILQDIETISPSLSGDQAFRILEELINQVKFLVTTTDWWAFQKSNPDIIVGESNTRNSTGELVETRVRYTKGIKFPPVYQLGKLLDALAILLKTIREENLEKGNLPELSKISEIAKVIEEMILNSQIPEVQILKVKQPKQETELRKKIRRSSTLSEISKALNSSQSPKKKDASKGTKVPKGVSSTRFVHKTRSRKSKKLPTSETSNRSQ